MHILYKYDDQYVHYFFFCQNLFLSRYYLIEEKALYVCCIVIVLYSLDVSALALSSSCRSSCCPRQLSAPAESSLQETCCCIWSAPVWDAAAAPWMVVVSLEEVLAATLPGGCATPPWLIRLSLSAAAPSSSEMFKFAMAAIFWSGSSFLWKETLLVIKSNHTVNNKVGSNLPKKKKYFFLYENDYNLLSEGQVLLTTRFFKNINYFKENLCQGY